ncbi:MAG: hypothetical protein U1F53_01680 [Burkholderiaceae bacterium]
MKILKVLLIVVVALAVLVFGGGMLISPKYRIQRSTLINAPADKAYPLVADPQGWKRWSVWNSATRR